MISIITAIYNQYAMNELFLDSLRKNTHNPYELIIIDNNSTDGSCELFEKNGATVIRNNGNYSYPHCQNQGIKAASGDVLVFFNNDILLSKNWDIHLLNVLGKNNYDVVSFASNDRMATRRKTKVIEAKWKYVKYPIRATWGITKLSLKFMFRMMYPCWSRFTKKIFEKYGYQMSEGFSGSVIAMNRKGLEKAGWWDESQQSADFDLYARTKQRCATRGDLQPLSIISGVYIHHYGRLTIKAKQKPVHFIDSQNLKSSEEKWGIENWRTITKDLEQ